VPPLSCTQRAHRHQTETLQTDRRGQESRSPRPSSAMCERLVGVGMRGLREGGETFRDACVAGTPRQTHRRSIWREQVPPSLGPARLASATPRAAGRPALRRRRSRGSPGRQDACVYVGGADASRPRIERSDAGDVGGEEVDAVAVEVSAGAVVVLGGPWVGVAGEDLGVAQWDAGVEGVGDRGVPQRVRADGEGYRQPSRCAAPSGRRRVGRRACRSTVSGSGVRGAFAAVGLQDPQDGHGHGPGLGCGTRRGGSWGGVWCRRCGRSGRTRGYRASS
jgi:hypothetical protein